MTLSDPTLARFVISSSVIPSAKYSWAGSPERFSSGSTAIELIRGLDATCRPECRKCTETTAAASTTNAAIAKSTQFLPVPGHNGFCTCDLGVCCSSTRPINRYPRPCRVSMKRGFSAESPKAALIFFTAVLSARSKSTKVSSGQIF